MKLFVSLFIMIPIVAVAQVMTTLESLYQNQRMQSGQIFTSTADSIAADSSGMRTLNPAQLAKEMTPGWNVGNSLEAVGGETAWGNPKITQKLIDSIKAAGFKSVRIPVSWSYWSDAASFSIDTNWMARVEQVVNYVLKDSMYAIFNEHWDGGWMQPTYAQQDYVNNRLAAMWRQIAIRFRNYGDHLLFAGMNEVMVTGNYSAPTKEYYTVHNSFAQTFVSTVRSTGGRNVYRYLAVQGFNTNIDYTVSYFAIPKDAVPNRLLIEVHYYDPYDFTINTGSTTISQWGSFATNPGKTETWANEGYADNQFQKMKTSFIDKGYAVILGEYGVIARTNLGSEALNAEFARYRLYYMEYITRSLARHGLIPFYWDNGSTGNNGMGIVNRSTGGQVYPDIVRAIIDTLLTTNGATGVNDLRVSPNPSRYSLPQNYPNPFNPTTVISYELAVNSNFSLRVFDMLGRQVTTLAQGIQAAGWYSAVWDARNVTSGIYFCRLSAVPLSAFDQIPNDAGERPAGSFNETKKLVLLR